MKDYSKELTSEQKTVKIFTDHLNKQIEKLELENKALKKQLTLTDVVSCVCKIPEPRMKNSENGISAYCNKCAKSYSQK
jgi:hypothetical protein